MRPTLPLLYYYIYLSIGLSRTISIFEIGSLYTLLYFKRSITNDILAIVYPVSMTFVAINILGVGLSSLDIYSGSFSRDIEFIETTLIPDLLNISEVANLFSIIVAYFYFAMNISILLGFSTLRSAIAFDIIFYLLS